MVTGICLEAKNKRGKWGKAAKSGGRGCRSSLYTALFYLRGNSLLDHFNTDSNNTLE